MPKEITYGISNLYFATFRGTSTYNTPVHIPYAAKLTIAPVSTLVSFKGIDGIDKQVADIFAGYDGTLSIYGVPDELAVDVLKAKKDENMAIIERIGFQSANCALLLESEGTRYAYYNAYLGHPTETLETIGEDVPVNVVQMPVKFRHNSNNRVRAYQEKGNNHYDDWFEGVYGA